MSLLLVLGYLLLGTAQTRAIPAPPIRGDATRTEASSATALFRRNCQTCHGADGKGAEAQRAKLTHVPDFTRATWQAKRRDEQLLASILDGKGSQMPPFSDRLSSEEARQLVAHVRRLGPHQSNRPAELSTTDFERRYRELEEEMKALRKQYRKVAPPEER
jgi:mono/diheme cytochrome c family protein